MERTVAIKKLGKILGKSLGYRVDPKAPDQDARDEARAYIQCDANTGAGPGTKPNAAALLVSMIDRTLEAT